MSYRNSGSWTKAQDVLFTIIKVASTAAAVFLFLAVMTIAIHLIG